MKTIMQDNTDYCFRCGRYAPTDWHHIFNAALKKKSEQYGAMIKVCRRCHEVIHTKEMAKTKALAQSKIMQVYGLSTDDFIKIFKRNYLW